MQLSFLHFILVVYIYTTFQIQVANCLEWVLDDAVHISAEIETRSPGENSLRQPGKCVKLRECYPILFLTDRADRDDPTSINSDLIDFILETSDTCQPFDYREGPKNASRINPGNVYVWCRTGLQKESLSSFAEAKPDVGIKAEDENNLCGQVKHAKLLQSEERVVGGSEVTPGEAPYLVAMVFRGKQVCGGSIIDSQHVLTAAHCVSHLKPTVLHHLQFLIGDHDIKNLADVDHQERNVSKIIYHKEFSKDTLHDDIAMIKLSEPIQFTTSVAPVCLHDGTNSVDEGTINGKLVGWGQLEEGGDRPATPRAAQLRIWKTEDCEDIYDGVVPDDIFEKVLCAGGFQDGGTTDACKGDSGGPLTVYQNKRQFQVGIVSFGIGCGRYPGVFTKVSEYQSWIDRHRTIVLTNE